MPRKTILTGSQRELQEEEEGYWSKASFERRFVQNTLREFFLLDEAEKYLGHEPQTLGDLWKVVKSDSARPIREQVGDLNEILTEKINATNRFLGLTKLKK